MKNVVIAILSPAIVLSLAGPASAFTSRQVRSVTVVSSGVTETTSMDPLSVVIQGQGDTPGALTFGQGGNTFRDSERALRVNLSTNLAANRLIIYTANLSGEAIPQAQINTGLGNDAGGLVGVTDSTQTVPLLWVIKDNNAAIDNHVFTSATVGDDEVYLTDRAHVRTYVLAVSGQAVGGTLDNLPTEMCSATATPPIPATNDPNDGLYPQYFGEDGEDQDVCSNAAVPVTIAGQTIQPGGKIQVAEELSKNIAVVAFGFSGAIGTAANLATPITTDTITVTAPFYLPLGADFRFAPPQDYATSTLTVELITQ